jgi:putative transposase
VHQRPMVSVEWLCVFFQKSRQAFYQKRHRKDKQNINEELIVDYVKAYRHEMKKIGTRKLKELLQPQLTASGIKCGRDRLFDILRRRDLLIRKRKRPRCVTHRDAISNHFSNLIEGKIIDEPEKVWVGDTTAVAVNDGLSYLVILTDAYSRLIMGYNYQRTKDRSGPQKALRMAVHRRWYPQKQLMYHSDGGREFYNWDFLQDLVRYHIKASCTAPGSPEGNPIAERINGILKEEFLLTEETRSFEQVAQMLPEAIRIYNERRPHASIDYKTPKEAHACKGLLRKRWKAYKSNAMRENEPTQIGREIQLIMQSWDLNVDNSLTIKKESSKERT